MILRRTSGALALLPFLFACGDASNANSDSDMAAVCVPDAGAAPPSGPILDAGAPPLPAPTGRELPATRLSGPAPLGVLFDATTLVAAGAVAHPFHQLRYEFDFGDERGETWPISGAPKNTQAGGPLAAHVFDEPGSYLVRVRILGGASPVEASVRIEVGDAHVAYAGAKTICVSTSANYGGCPTGALHQTTIPAPLAGKRVLLRRGETFPGINVRRTDDDVRFSAFGPGTAKPRVERVDISGGTPGNDGFADDVSILGLSIRNGIHHESSAARMMLYKNDLDTPGGDNSITIGGAIGYYAERNPGVAFYHPREIFVVENRVIGQVNDEGTPFLNFQGAGSRFAVLGNDMARAQEHTARFFALHKSVVAHNAFRGQAHSASGPSIRSAIKLHSGGLGPYADDLAVSGTSWATSQVVIADNLLGDATNNGSFTAGAAPQNADVGTVEGIEDVIFERNRFVRGPHTNTELHNVGRRITTRGNVRVDGGPPQISVGTPGPSMPAAWIGPYFNQ